MNTTTTYDESVAKAVESAVQLVFNCRLSDIVSVRDTDQKKVVVYVLNKFYGFDKRNIGRAYGMTYLYVPTVVDDLDGLFLNNACWRSKIIQVLTLMQYEFKEKTASA